MRVAAHMLGFGIDRFLPTSIDSLMPHVDKLFVARADLPFAYNPVARLNFRNPTPTGAFDALGYGSRVEVIEGDWLTEEAARNACLDRARAEGFDWLLIVDADELYPDSSWEQARKVLAGSVDRQHVVTTWYNFFKTSRLVLEERNGSHKSTNAGFAIRCLPHLRFTHKRISNASRSVIADCPCFHYGYVMSDAEMWTKVSTWSHSADFDARKWFRLKWQRWQPNTKYLHPTDPTSWRRAVPFPFEQPAFAEKFDLELPQRSTLSPWACIEDGWYNGRALCTDILRASGRNARKALGRVAAQRSE